MSWKKKNKTCLKRFVPPLEKDYDRQILSEKITFSAKKKPQLKI
jgi:hypothetical protein